VIEVTYLIQWVCVPVFHKVCPVHNIQRVFFITEHSPAKQAATVSSTVQQVLCFKKYSQYGDNPIGISGSLLNPFVFDISVKCPSSDIQVVMATATTLTILSSGTPFLIITQNDDTLVGLQIFHCARRTRMEQFIVLSHIDPI